MHISAPDVSRLTELELVAIVERPEPSREDIVAYIEAHGPHAFRRWERARHELRASANDELASRTAPSQSAHSQHVRQRARLIRRSAGRWRGSQSTPRSRDARSR